jgi:hypothetical protein
VDHEAALYAGYSCGAVAAQSARGRALVVKIEYGSGKVAKMLTVQD